MCARDIVTYCVWAHVYEYGVWEKGEWPQMISPPPLRQIFDYP